MFSVSGRFRVTVLACLVSISAVVAGSPALAQDYKRPASWTGFYFGAHGGYAWTDIEHPLLAAAPVGPPVQELEGGLLGAQVGAQYEFRTASCSVSRRTSPRAI